jgi:UBX domain-containing protein 1
VYSHLDLPLSLLVPMTPEQQDTVDQFIAITGSTPEQAAFILDASKWDLHTATETHFAADQPATSSQPKSAPASQQKMKTLNDILKNEAKDKDTEEWYAGGEKSGQAIQGPPGKKKNAHDLVENIMKQAVQAGPREEQEKPTSFGGSGYRLGTENTGAASEPAVKADAEEKETVGVS